MKRFSNTFVYIRCCWLVASAQQQVLVYHPNRILNQLVLVLAPYSKQLPTHSVIEIAQYVASNESFIMKQQINFLINVGEFYDVLTNTCLQEL